METSYITYHGSLYHDMNVYHDIDKSDEIITTCITLSIENVGYSSHVILLQTAIANENAIAHFLTTLLSKNV